MSIKKNVKLIISKGTSKEELTEFLESIPDSAKIDVEAYVDRADRPYESDTVRVTLVAEWDSAREEIRRVQEDQR